MSNLNNSNNKTSLGTKGLVTSGLFTALTAVCSWINIPLFFTPVPVNMALIGPYLAGLILGCKYGIFSQIIYILLGAVGLPVFAGFAAGASVVVGPTGGFLVGYVLCAAVCGLPPRKSGSKMRVLLMLCGLAACYVCGLIWFMFTTKASLWAGLTACVLPFLPGDAIKIALAAVLSRHLSKALKI